MNKLYAMLPCYNEEPNVEPLTEKWLALTGPLREKGYDLSVTVIDDCSRDGTAGKAQALAEKYPDRVRLIRHKVNKGLGGGLATAFRLFAEEGAPGDLCALMDGDNSHDPVYTLDMLPLIAGGCDCVIASRYQGGAETHGLNVFRKALSGGARWFYTGMLGVRGVRDYTCGYRMYTYALIQKAIGAYGDGLVERRSFACMMEVLYKLSLIGARFGEVPFSLRYDHKQGESKMRVLKTVWESVDTAVKLRLGEKRRIRRA